MRIKWYKTRKRWRLIVPVRFTGTGKKQFILFKSKPEGEAEIRRILNRGNSSRPQISEADEAAITLAKDLRPLILADEYWDQSRDLN